MENPTQEEREKLNQQKIQDKVNQDKKKKLAKKVVIYSILVLIIASLIYFPISNSKKPGKYDDFAKCLTENDAKEYGAFWCPNCAEQKRLFGKSFQYITYVECDARGKDPKPQLCKEKKITGYPTWEINHTLYPGLMSLEELSTLSGCSLKEP